MEHHAYFAEGSLDSLNVVAVEAARRLQITIRGNPDVVVRSYASFGIDDARDLKALAELSPVHGKKLFVIGASAITSDAQNALLKVFEEPAAHTHFVLLVPHGTLLPTLRSRCMRFDFAHRDGGAERNEAELFLKGPYAARSAHVEKLLKDKERERVRTFLNALEAVLYDYQGPGRERALR